MDRDTEIGGKVIEVASGVNSRHHRKEVMGRESWYGENGYDKRAAKKTQINL